MAAAVLILGGCASVKKQRSRAQEFFREHPAELAELCADKFPPRIEYRPGKTETLIHRDTVTTPGDSIPCPETVNPETGEKYIPKVKCPDTQLITERWLRTDSLLQASTAREEQYRLESERHARSAATERVLREQAEKTSRNRGWALGGVLAAIAGYFILKGRRII